MVKRRPGKAPPKAPKRSKKSAEPEYDSDDSDSDPDFDLDSVLENIDDVLDDSDDSSDDDDEEEMGSNYVLSERTPAHSMDDLKGIDDILKTLRKKAILPFAFPERATLLKKKVQKGILLTGLPGTGKTALADAIVDAVRAKGRNVRYYQERGQCISKWVGESEGNLRKLFRTAKATAPSIIFLDELDGLGMAREEGSSNRQTVLTTLLQEINDVKPGQVMVIAATNCPHLCDFALIREGRFDLTIEVPLPTPEGREHILKHYLDKVDIELNPKPMTDLVERTGNRTGAYLKNLAENIYDNAVDRLFPDEDWGDDNMSDEEAEERLEELEIDWDLDIEPLLPEPVGGGDAAPGNDEI